MYSSSGFALNPAYGQPFALDELLQCDRILLLQGPVGRFFTRLAAWLEQGGKEYRKVNFNGGDLLYFPSLFNPSVVNFQPPASGFAHWLADYSKTFRFDAVVCFADGREYHQIAREYCQQNNIGFYVFEEGYIRPDYITLEKDGVNAWSAWAGLTPEQVRQLPELPPAPAPASCHPPYLWMVWKTFCYIMAYFIFRRAFPHYRSHRGYGGVAELLFWSRSYLRRWRNGLVEPARLKKFLALHHDHYFLCTLQVFNDFQLNLHSTYGSVGDFITEVMTSFATHALPEDHLVIKHHPMDRGYRNYKKYIRQQSRQLGIEHRVIYLCDVHLPTLIQHARGMITVNSTTGLQSLFRGKPVKLMGRAIYNHPGITAQMPMDQFWTQYSEVDMSCYMAFKRHLIWYTQLNGCYYGGMPWMQQFPARLSPPRSTAPSHQHTG